MVTKVNERAVQALKKRGMHAPDARHLLSEPEITGGEVDEVERLANATRPDLPTYHWRPTRRR